MKVLRNSRNQLRAIWRMIAYVLLGVVAFVPFIPILKILPSGLGGNEVLSIANLVFVLCLNISFVLAAWIILRWVDRKPLAFLGFNFWPSSIKELFVGIGLGIANFGLVFLVLCVFGWISVGWGGVTIADWSTVILYLATYFVFASIEEIINRGYLFQTLCEGIGVVAAAVIISLVFSFGHMFNEDFSTLSAIFLFIHGLMYAVAYLKTRSLWTPIGLHLAWNFFQGPVAGMQVSGTTVNNTLFLTKVNGPDLLTGGSFGAEGGLVAIVISIVVLVVLFKANWLKPSERFLEIERIWHRNDKS